jgi:hypothetical protein
MYYIYGKQLQKHFSYVSICMDWPYQVSFFKLSKIYTDVPSPLVPVRFLPCDGENTEVQSDMETLDPW